MKGFKEWFSDYLRYFLLILAAALLFGIAYIGVRVYQNYDSPTAGDNIEILTEAHCVTEKSPESGSEKSTETGTESPAEDASEGASEKEAAGEDGAKGGKASGGTAGAKTSAQAETQSQASAQAETQPQTSPQAEAQPQTLAQTEAQPQTSAQTETQPQTSPQTETQPQTEPEPVYRTMTGACNFRSGPGYEYEVMAEYPAGTVVEFLGIVEGWCEVRIDGVIGYMGQRFFE